jgi:uncharacterized membrane protein
MEIIKIFLISMTPIGELRVALPVALTVYQMDPLLAYFVSVSGNILAVFLLLVFLGFVSRWLSQHFYFFNRFFSWLFSKTRENHSLKVEKYGAYALPLFVALPLPITGGWTACLVAFVFGIPFRKAFPLISLGVLTAGVIVFFLSTTGIAMHKYFGWQVFSGIVILGIFSYLILNKIKRNGLRKKRFSN